MNIKDKIRDYEFYNNGFHKLSGRDVIVQNMMVDARKKIVFADIILIDDNEPENEELFEYCEYPFDVLGLSWNKGDNKVWKAIEVTEKFIQQAEAKGVKDFENGNITVLGCEKRNLEEYYQMLGQDKRKLRGRLRELYQAV